MELEVYELIYDWNEDERNIRDEIAVESWDELQETIKELRKLGYYNISANFMYTITK